MPTDDEILEANRTLTRLARRLLTSSPHVDVVDEIEADIVTIRRGLGISFERAPTLGEVFDPDLDAAAAVHDFQAARAPLGPDEGVIGPLTAAALARSLGLDPRDGAGSLLGVLNAIDGNIADLAGAVREVAATLARHSNIGPDPDEAEKAHASKRAKRTRKKK